MSLQQDIRTHMVKAMKEKDALRLSVLRGLMTAFTNELTATKRTPQDELADDEVLAVIRRSLKQRKDAAEQYRGGGRKDLAEKEEQEAEVLLTYLPAQMDADAIRTVVEAKVQALGVAGPSDKGKLMGAVMGELKDKADGQMVRDVVNDVLAKL
jgi:uncharacterized protein